jgi:hypothetical protein
MEKEATNSSLKFKKPALGAVCFKVGSREYSAELRLYSFAP